MSNVAAVKSSYFVFRFSNHITISHDACKLLIWRRKSINTQNCRQRLASSRARLINSELKSFSVYLSLCLSNEKNCQKSFKKSENVPSLFYRVVLHFCWRYNSIGRPPPPFANKVRNKVWWVLLVHVLYEFFPVVFVAKTLRNTKSLSVSFLGGKKARKLLLFQLCIFLQIFLGCMLVSHTEINLARLPLFII